MVAAAGAELTFVLRQARPELCPGTRLQRVRPTRTILGPAPVGNELIDGVRQKRTVGGIRRRQRLGGLLNYYYRAA